MRGFNFNLNSNMNEYNCKAISKNRLMYYLESYFRFFFCVVNWVDFGLDWEMI